MDQSDGNTSATVEKVIQPFCLHCHGPKEVRNPSGYCDHLCWPDNLSDEAKIANGYEIVMSPIWVKRSGDRTDDRPSETGD